jgi:hypothetical protein
MRIGVTKEAATFVGEIDLIWYCWEYCTVTVDGLWERYSGL